MLRWEGHQLNAVAFRGCMGAACMPERQDTTWMYCTGEEKETGLCLITSMRANHVTSISSVDELLCLRISTLTFIYS